MNRYLLTWLSLFAVVFWLVFSYASPAGITWPTLVYPSAWGAGARWLAVVGLVAFLMIQGLILWSTSRIKLETLGEPPAGGRQMSVAVELFWTILPLLMTVGLAYLSYQTWLSLPTG